MILSPKSKKEPHPLVILLSSKYTVTKIKNKNEFLNCSCLMGTSRVDCMSMNF